MQTQQVDPVAPATLVPGGGARTQETEDEIAPSRAMEYWLFTIMAASLVVSISGLAFVYGFDLAHPFSPANISPGVRGVIVDSILFLGVYFTRRFLMSRRKRLWHWFWGLVWLLVAVLATSFSWFSNTLAVNALGTSVSSALLTKAGFGSWDAAEVNQVIAALPIVAILLYGIVPRRMKAAPKAVDTRTPEEVLREAEQEAARIQAERIVRQARAEEVGAGLGDGISALTRGVNLALGRDPAARKAEAETLRQMRVLLLRHGWVESQQHALKLRPEQVRLLAESKRLWDAATNRPQPWALLPTEGERRTTLRKLALAHHWLTPQEVEAEDEMGYAALEARYAALALRAEELRQQEERQHPSLSTVNTKETEHGILALPPRDETLPVTRKAGPSAPREGLTPEELGQLLTPKKSRTTILNWMKPNATEPRKIYPQEVVVDGRGTQRITPEGFVRLKRALDEDGTFSRGAAPPHKVLPKATQRGAKKAAQEAEGAEPEHT